jgi:exosortase
MTDTPASRPAPLPLGILAGIFILFFAVNPQIVADWRIYSFDDGTYSHAYLIPFMSAYLAWVGWREGHLTTRWSWTFFGLALAALLLYQWMDFAHQRYLSRALIPACLTFLTLAMLRPTRHSIAIGAFFWFVTPVWGPVNELLQRSSVSAVSYIMSFTGIPTFVYDNFVEIPAGTFEIADGCSGLRYVISALALVVFYSVMYLKRLRSIALLTLLALLGAMLTNWLRIVVLILIGQYSDMQAEIISDHNMFGWFLFIPFMFLLFFFADRLERQEHMSDQDAIRVRESSYSRGELALLFVAIALISGVALRMVAHQPLPGIDGELDVEVAQPLSFSATPHPKIYAVTSVRSMGASDGDEIQHKYVFSFDGSTDAQRAEFYMNDLVPSGWKEVGRAYSDDRVMLQISNNEQQGTVSASYVVGGVNTARRGYLRKLRLLAALRLDRGSELHWAYTPCLAEAQCALEKSN